MEYSGESRKRLAAPKTSSRGKEALAESNDTTGNNQNFVWLAAEDPAKQVASTVRRLIRDQNPRLVQNTRFASLYTNEDLMRPVRGSNANSQRANMPRQTLNLIKVHTDTLAGKLVQSNSRVQAMTIQGDWETFRLARKLDRLLDATFLQGRLFREMSRVVTDAITVGNGYLYVGEEDGKICYERWYYNEIFFDMLDAMYGCPTMMFRIRYMHPQNALAYWGDSDERRAAIQKAPPALEPSFSWTPYQTGMIEIFEAWALELPNRPGRHVLCTAAGVLIDEDYTHQKFPVVNFSASDYPLGPYGQGFTAHSGSTQIWINRILDIMARSAHLGVAPYWVVAGGADISSKQMNNVEGHIISSNGPAPQWVTNPPFHESATQYVELLKTQMSIMYGINEIESSGAMPLNRLDSNPALIQAQDMWMARHTILLKNYSEEVFMDVAERTVQVAQDIAKKKGSYPVVATGAGRAWAMDWRDFVKMKRESYRLMLAPENALPLTPAARKKLIMELGAQGALPPDRVTQLMFGGSDLDKAIDEITAYQKHADWICEQLYEGEDPEISELQKPELLLGRVRAAGLMAQEYGAPDNIVLNFEQYASRLVNLISQTQQAMMPPPGLPNVGPASPGIPQ